MSAGIKYNDTETQKKYLRYCEDYKTAWIEFLPEICETIRKFDSKKVTKRIDTAIKKIDNRFSFGIKKSTYDTNAGYVCLDWYDYDGRQFRDDITGQWEYVKGFNDYGIILHFVEDMECFDTEKFVKELENRAEYYTARRKEVYSTLDNLDLVKEEYNKAVKSFMDIIENIPCEIMDYYELSNTYLSEW